MLFLWSLISSMGLYQDPETCISPPTRVRCTYGCLHRRHISAGGVQTVNRRPSIRTSLFFGMFGIHDQQEKINLRANSITGFPWSGSRYNINGIKTTWGKICSEVNRTLRAESISAGDLSHLLGKMNATSQVIPPAPLFYHHLQMSLTQTLNSTTQDYEANITLSQDCTEELNWWIGNMSKWNGKARGKSTW